MHFVDEALVVKYGGHADQLSRQYPAMDRFRVRALDRLMTTQALRDDDFTAARATLLQKLDILLKGARKHGNLALIDELHPVRQRWQAPLPVARC